MRLKRMKLTKRISKDEAKNKEYVSYQVRKINDFGEGFVADKPLEGKFVFEPRIGNKGQPISYVKDGEKKTFTPVSAVIQLFNIDDFEGLELNQYGSATFDLPEKFAPIILKHSPVKDKGVQIVLKSFTGKDDKENDVKKTVWTMEIEGEVPAEEQKTLETAKPISLGLEEFDKAYKDVLKKGVEDTPQRFIRAYFANTHTEEYLRVKEYAEGRNTEDIATPNEVEAIPEEVVDLED